MKNKKAQITLFIIIGIIILLGAIVVLYIRSQTTEVTEQGLTLTKEVPTVFIPIVEYTTKCLQDVSVVGFKKIGEHGGYIDVEDPYLSNRVFSLNRNPTESDALSLGDEKIVYWWYMDSPNKCSDCTLTSLLPTIPEIEEQINRYIKRKLQNCINEFQPFREQGFEIDEGDVTAITTINTDDVRIDLKYPLEIQRGDSTFEISDFNINLDLHFLDVYVLALATTIEQINEQFLEEIILHQISLYSFEINSNLIPPIFGLDNAKSTETWEVDKVEERLQKYVLPNLMQLQIKNTKDAVRITSNNALEQGAYDVMFLGFLNQTEFPYSSVNFLYASNWPIYFDISPKSGNKLKPTVHKQDYALGIVDSSQSNTYEFFYDIAAPLLITIKDDRSLRNVGEEGYTFMFALEANIRDNKNMQEWSQGEGTFGTIDYSKVSFSYNDLQSSQANCIPSNPKYTCPANGMRYDNEVTCKSSCNNADCMQSYTLWICEEDGETYASESDCALNCKSETQQRISEGATKSLFCDISQRLSGDLKINVNDGKSSEELSDVVISFRCGNNEQCAIGSTNSSGEYMSKFPICIGDGFLTLEKEEYLTEVVPHISINLGESKTINAELEPLIEKEVEALYINVTNLFRTKKKLETINDHIVDLVEDAITEQIWIPPPHYLQPFPANKLRKSEAELILKDIKATRVNAENLIKEVEYHFQANRINVVKATKLIKKATTAAYNLVYEVNQDPNFIDSLINRGFTGQVNIGNDALVTLKNDLVLLDKELENIQFLEDPELISSSNIQKYRNQAKGLKPTEQIIVSLEKIKENQYEQNLPLPQAIIQNNSVPKIKLVPGQYKVNLQFQDLNGLMIPQPTGGNFDYTPAQLGGVELNNVSGYWVFNENDLNNANRIRFYFLKIDNPEEYDDLNELGKIDEYSKRYRAYIEPEFLP